MMRDLWEERVKANVEDIERMVLGRGMFTQRPADDDTLACLAGYLARSGPPSFLSFVVLDRSPALVRQVLAAQTRCIASYPASIAMLMARRTKEERRIPDAVRRRYNRLTPGDIAWIASFRPECAGFLALASDHGNGYVREAAVHGMAGLTEPFVFAALLDRINDWVGPISAAALAVAEGFLHPDRAPALIDNIEALLAMGQPHRRDHRPFVTRCLAAIQDPLARSHLREGAFHHSDENVRRICYRMLIASGPGDDVLRQGLETWSLQVMAAVAIRALPADRPVDAFLPFMLHNRLRPVRQAALELIAERQGAEAIPHMRAFLNDRSGTLREFARYYLNKFNSGVDPAAWYRDALDRIPHNHSGAHPLPVLIAGLMESGNFGDLARLLPYLTHASAKVRQAACRAFDRLGNMEHPDPFLTLLDDASGRVRQAATTALLRRRACIARAEISGHCASTAAGRLAFALVLAAFPGDDRARHCADDQPHRKR